MPSSDSPPRSGSLATITTPEVSGLPRLDAAVAVVTGGTRGIGLHTAVGLAALGADVITTGRDRNQGELAVRRIAATVPGAAVRYVPTDLSTLAGIRTAGALLLEAATRIDVLVHNAGVLLTSPVRTTDGFDLTVMVNHLAPFLLTHLLRPVLAPAGDDESEERPGRARVLYVTSGAARFGRVDVEQLLARHPADPATGDPSSSTRTSSGGFGAYGGSKALSVLTTVEQAHRTAGDPSAPAVHLVDPGGANTSLVQGMTDGMSTPVRRTLFRLFGPGRRSPATAARSSLVGAASSDLDGRSGRWVGAGGRIGNPPRRLTDPHLRRRAWDLTVERVGLDESDLPPGTRNGLR